jgi:hypothetical protein
MDDPERLSLAGLGVRCGQLDGHAEGGDHAGRRAMNRRFVRSVRRVTPGSPGACAANRSITDGCNSHRRSAANGGRRGRVEMLYLLFRAQTRVPTTGRQQPSKPVMRVRRP